MTLINEQIKSHRLHDKIGVLQEHKKKLDEVSSDISQKLEEEIRKNDFFTNPDNIRKDLYFLEFFFYLFLVLIIQIFFL